MMCTEVHRIGIGSRIGRNSPQRLIYSDQCIWLMGRAGAPPARTAYTIYSGQCRAPEKFQLHSDLCRFSVTVCTVRRTSYCNIYVCMLGPSVVSVSESHGEGLSIHIMD